MDHFLLITKHNPGNFSDYKEHAEANEYNGCEYFFSNQKYIQRTAKITPKKVGQFVTLWKRNEHGITTPLNYEDDFDFVVILCFNEKRVGRFIFPKDILLKKNILSTLTDKDSGKRGFRIYPSWDIPINRQAISTQNWQINYFSEQLSLKNQN